MSDKLKQLAEKIIRTEIEGIEYMTILENCEAEGIEDVDTDELEKLVRGATIKISWDSP